MHTTCMPSDLPNKIERDRQHLAVHGHDHARRAHRVAACSARLPHGSRVRS